MPPTEQVNMSVEDELATLGAGVGDESIAPIETLLLGDPPRERHEVGELAGVLGQLDEILHVPARDEQDVGRSLRVDVAEGERQLRLIDDPGGDLALENGAEQAHRGDHARKTSLVGGGQPEPAATRHRDVPTMQLSRPDRVVDEPLGADAAITALYAVHWRPLVRLAWLLVRDQGLAEDIVQDAFVATHQNWDRIREPAAAAAYLRRSVVNGARSAHRHDVVVQRELRAEAGRADALGRASGASAEAEALAELGNDQMLHALAQLPPRQREVLVLRYYADLSEAQIADALQIAQGSVKAHAHRALAVLRARMEDPR